MIKNLKLWFLKKFYPPCIQCDKPLDIDYSIIFYKDAPYNKPIRVRLCGPCTDKIKTK